MSIYVCGFAPPGTKQTLDPLQWDFVGKNLFAMAVEGLIFFIFTILLQYKFFINFRQVFNNYLNIINTIQTEVEVGIKLQHLYQSYCEETHF